MSYINKQSGTRSIQLCKRTKKLLLMCQANQIVLWARHIPGRLNVLADILSRPSQMLGLRYRMVSASICLPSTDSGIGNPIIGSVCNEMESETSTICTPRSRSISRGSRCSVSELEATVGIRIPTTSSVTTGAREGPTGPVRIDPHCPTLAPGNQVPTTLRDVGTISTPDIQSPLRIPNIPWLLSQPRGQLYCDPSNLQLHTWRVSRIPSAAEAF